MVTIYKNLKFSEYEKRSAPETSWTDSKDSRVLWPRFSQTHHRIRLRTSRYQGTVKLGYNELGYNETSVITNKNNYLVGLGHFHDIFSWL